MNKVPSYTLTLKRKPTSHFGFDLRETKVAKIQFFDDVTCKVTKTKNGFEIKIEDVDTPTTDSNPSCHDSYDDDAESQIDAGQMLRLAHSNDQICGCDECLQNEDTERICKAEPGCICSDCLSCDATLK